MTTWTPEKEKVLLSMHRDGATLRTISEEVGLSLRNVQAKAERLGLARRYSPCQHTDPTFIRMRAEGKTAQQIADAFGVSLKRVQNWISVGIRAGTVERHVSAKVTVWTDDKVAEFRRLWAVGHGPAAISRIMDVTVRAAQNRARALGLTGDRSYPKARKAAPPRDYRMEHLVGIARKPRPHVTSETWLKTATSRPFLSRERSECAWPLGERGDYHACCAETLEGDSYCEHHRLMAGGLKITGVRMDRKDWKMAA